MGFFDKLKKRKAPSDEEIILKQNTIYCFRAIANAAGYVNYDMEYYEHANRTA